MIINIENADKIYIRNSCDIYAIMRLILTEEYKIDGTKEHFWTIALNQANKIVNIELVSFGSYRSTASEPAEIFSIPLQKKAACVILIHNHPSHIPHL
jgi:DNA repair protein RadC